MVSGIDSVNHVGIVVHDMAACVAAYEAMGFQLTPFSKHSGAQKPGEAVKPYAYGNRCIMFGQNYLEIIANVDPENPEPRMAGYLRRHQGGHIICFNAEDMETADEIVRGNGLESSGVIPLQRDIDTPDGTKTAKFERAQFAIGETPEGYIQAARHLTPEYIYQPRYITHANDCTALSGVFLVVDDVAGYAARYGKILGREPELSEYQAVFSLPSLSRLTIFDYQHAGHVLPGTLLSGIPSICGVTFKTSDLAALRERLTGQGFQIIVEPGRIVVPAEQASGIALVFEG
ncbi:MAG: VOC family protein [Rhodospirillaceae bacterium]|nr:VOC family protein [Rhodospirillaceae bacterium]MBT4487207.1 VOC family protein [Rhodospirillaceae bacterium]MBT5895051.1 VOC family protein [Rhodospirillaceae bacterium]MBT6430530.1 VOC family protein [Rhodospirillaceae bacterium]MBT7757236.1 VOC family protein [Rhodospirillaceae bacterium]